MLTLFITALTPFLSGCASTPAGKSVARAQYADMASTGIALARGASEANPLGASLLILKPLLPLAVDRVNLPCQLCTPLTPSMGFKRTVQKLALFWLYLICK